MYYVVSNELYHHGIKGQKWGVRRFQNEDGSLTTAGKARHGDPSQSYSAKQEYKAKRKAAKQEFKKERKDISSVRSTGAKIATNILAGPFANRTYNSVIASGGSVTKARIVTAVASAGNVIGHLLVSSYYASKRADAVAGNITDYTKRQHES